MKVKALSKGLFAFGASFILCLFMAAPVLSHSTIDPTLGAIENDVLGVRLTTNGLQFLENNVINPVIQDPILLDYVNCLLKGALDRTPDPSDVEWDADRAMCKDDPSYPNRATYDPGGLLDPTCIDIPLVGTACFYLVVRDLDGDNLVLTWDTNSGSWLAGGYPAGTFAANMNEDKIGDPSPAHDYDDTLDIMIRFANIKMEAELTYPVQGVNSNDDASTDTCDSTETVGPACLTGCSEMTDVGAAYVPEQDRSNYPVVSLNIVIGCLDGDGAPLSEMGTICGEDTIEPLILSAKIRILAEYNDLIHKDYDTGDAADKAICDPDVWGASPGCHHKALSLDFKGIDFFTSIFFSFDRSWCVTQGAQCFGGPFVAPTDPDCNRYTDNDPPGCSGSGCIDFADDPNYGASQSIPGLVPFLQAELYAKMQDTFTCECLAGTFPGGDDGNTLTADTNECEDPGCPGQVRADPACTCGGNSCYYGNLEDLGCVGYYIAATPLINLGELLDTISFEHPLQATGPSYPAPPDNRGWLAFDLGLRTDFWADDYGILIPGAMGFDLLYFKEVAAPANMTPVTSQASLLPPFCNLYPVNATASISGYPAEPVTSTTVAFPEGTTGSGYMFDTEKTPSNAPPDVNNVDYMIGVGIHQNALSRILFNAIASAALCIDINGNTPTLGEMLTSFLTTDVFQLLMPELANRYTNDAMEIRIRPAFSTPEWAANATGAGNEPGITPFPVTAINSPFIVAGGYTVGDIGYSSATWVVTTFPNVASTTADITVGIPHIRLDFVVYNGVEYSGDPPYTLTNPERIFGLDLGILAGVDLELFRDDTRFIQRTFPGDITTVTGRIIHIGTNLGTAVQYYVEYYEALSGLSRNDLNGILGNLLPVILNLALGGKLEIGLDYGALFPVPLTLTLEGDCEGSTTDNNPPCYASVITGSGPNQVIGGGDANDSGISWNPDTNFTIPGLGTAIKPSDIETTANSVGDWLGIYLGLAGRMNARGVLELISGGFGGMSIPGFGAPPVSYNIQYTPPESYIVASSRLDAMNASFHWYGIDDDGGNGNLRYSYRLDSGLWTPFRKIYGAEFSYLVEGMHKLEVKAVDRKGNMEPTPSVYRFRIDSIGPKIRILGTGQFNAVSTRSPYFYIEAKDAQAPDELVKVAYRVDDGEWSDFDGVRTIRLSDLSTGLHRLDVRAMDDVGNISSSSLTFKVIDGIKTGFGCSTVNSTASGFLPVFLLIPGILIIRRLW